MRSRKTGAAEIWEKMAIHRYWALLVQDCVEAYYAHPWAWDEIGFGGPAYPRAYMRLEHGEPEPWEVEEQRYEWEAPPDAVSDPEEAGHRRPQRTPAARTGRHALKATARWRRSSRADDRVHHLGSMQTIEFPMKRYADERGDRLSHRRRRSGGRRAAPAAGARRIQSASAWKPGPFWDTERDWVSDEAGSHQLYWEDMRITGGKNPLALGANNCGKGVGGGSVHWAAFTPRFHPSDFEVYTRDGVGADWPISYWDLEALLRIAGAGDARGRPGVVSVGRSAWLRLSGRIPWAAWATRSSAAARTSASASAPAARWRS